MDVECVTFISIKLCGKKNEKLTATQQYYLFVVACKILPGTSYSVLQNKTPAVMPSMVAMFPWRRWPQAATGRGERSRKSGSAQAESVNIFLTFSG